MWELTLGWYGDRLHPGYRPAARPHLQGLITAAGLTSHFWQLA